MLHNTNILHVLHFISLGLNCIVIFIVSCHFFYTERSNLSRIRKTQGNFAEKKHLVQEAESWRDWIWRKYKNREERRTICWGRKMRAQFLTKSKSWRECRSRNRQSCILQENVRTSTIFLRPEVDARGRWRCGCPRRASSSMWSTWGMSLSCRAPCTWRTDTF